MTAEQALQAHREWKDRFRVAMAKREQLNIAEIASDSCCPFGQWLHGQAEADVRQAPAYSSCVTAHAEFHREAGKIATLVNAGRMLDADRMMAHGTPYTGASEALAMSVIAMFKEAAAARG